MEESIFGIHNYDDFNLFTDDFFKPKRKISTKNLIIEIQVNTHVQKTDLYDLSIPVVRRGNSLSIRYKNNETEGDELNNISLLIQTKRNCHLPSFELTPSTPRQSCFFYAINQEDAFKIITLKTDINSPIGFYKIWIKEKGEMVGSSLLFYLIFNPLNKKDSVYTDDENKINEYLLANRIKIYAGSREYHFGKAYYLNQFLLPCTWVCGYFLSLLPMEDRSDPIKVTRAFTALVNGNDDNGLIYGNWGEIHEGTSPSAWTNAQDIYLEYLKSGRSVKWGQCFVFSMLMTSMCRNIGILCRSVSGFEIGHDNNLDGIITMRLDDETLELLPDSETLWNFHAWNNVLIKRSDFSIDSKIFDNSKSSWQHADGTPQERSQGIYQCGPYPVEMLRRQLYSLHIPYDAPGIFHSINYVRRYLWVKENRITRESKREESCMLIVTTDLKKKYLDITDEYRASRTYDQKEPLKLQVELEAPRSIEIDQLPSFTVKVSRALEGSSTLVAISAELVNTYGRPLLSKPLLNQSHVFSGTNFTFTDTIKSLYSNENIDMSIVFVKWTARCFNNSIGAVGEAETRSMILPCVSLSFDESIDKVSKGINQITIFLKNKLNRPIENCCVRLHIKDTSVSFSNAIEKLPVGEEIKFTIPVDFKNFKHSVLQAFFYSDVYNGKLGRRFFMTL